MIAHDAEHSRINAAYATAFMPLRDLASTVDKRGVMEAPERIRVWLKTTAAEIGLSPAAWAHKAGVAPSTVQRALKPTYEFVTSSRTLAKLAKVAGVSPPMVTSTRLERVDPLYLPVRYKVQAGHWYETDTDEPPTQAQLAVAPDARFAKWPQWLELVVGDSVNTKIPAGHYAHVVDAIEMGYAPRDGDWVVVERRRDQGATRERTIKQVAMVGPNVELWPRSTNPKWCAPILVTNGTRAGEEFEAEIVGPVIGAYNPEF